MLAEVRKEAFAKRFHKTEKSSTTAASADDEEEEQDETASSTIMGPEAWTNWCPQEWVAWVMYGVPSENPMGQYASQQWSYGSGTLLH
jgi:hypothetical protein